MNNAVILAGGQGKRMKADIPKPMFKVLEEPMLEWVIKACEEAELSNLCIVKGYMAEKIDEYLNGRYETVLQSERLGTGHAVMQAVPAIHILRLVAEAAEDHHPAAALLEARDAHHHMLQTSSRGILSEISCHGTLLLSKQKSGSCLCCTVCADAAPAFSDVTYQFVAPVLVPAPVCPPDLGQYIRSLSLRSAWL